MAMVALSDGPGYLTQREEMNTKFSRIDFSALHLVIFAIVVALIAFSLPGCGGGGGGGGTTAAVPAPLTLPPAGTYSGQFSDGANPPISVSGSVTFTGDDKGSFTTTLSLPACIEGNFESKHHPDNPPDIPASISGQVTVDAAGTGYNVDVTGVQQASDHHECPSLPTDFIGIFKGVASYSNGPGGTFTFTNASNGSTSTLSFN